MSTTLRSILFSCLLILLLGFTKPRVVSAGVDATSPSRTGIVSPQKNIYLTFDADMTPRMASTLHKGRVKRWYEPEILSYLGRLHVPATLFVTGMFAEEYPHEITSWSRDPNIEIENHTYDHRAFELPCFRLSGITTDQEKNLEINKTQRILHALTGIMPHLFRYPGLCHNTHDDTLVRALGLTIEDGTLVSGDAFNKNTARIARGVIRKARPGSIIVMHLGGPNAPKTLSALQQIIPKLQHQGFSFRLLWHHS